MLKASASVPAASFVGLEGKAHVVRLDAEMLAERAGEAAPNLIPQRVRGPALIPKPSFLSLCPCLRVSALFHRGNLAGSLCG